MWLPEMPDQQQQREEETEPGKIVIIAAAGEGEIKYREYTLVRCRAVETDNRIISSDIVHATATASAAAVA